MRLCGTLVFIDSPNMHAAQENLAYRKRCQWRVLYHNTAIDLGAAWLHIPRISFLLYLILDFEVLVLYAWGDIFWGIRTLGRGKHSQVSHRNRRQRCVNDHKTFHLCFMGPYQPPLYRIHPWPFLAFHVKADDGFCCASLHVGRCSTSKAGPQFEDSLIFYTATIESASHDIVGWS
jgi:hypothetical protein